MSQMIWDKTPAFEEPQSGSSERLQPNNRLRLVCLPYAGGGTSPYYRWRSLCPDAIALLPICLSGREERLKEPLHSDIMTAATEIADSIQGITTEPYALLGHSMGAILAFELARELRRRKLPTPQRLIVSACAAPDALSQQEAIHQLADEDFLAEVHRRFQAVPREVAENEELKQLLLPILRADVQMLETYRFQEEPPLEIDLLAISGSDDSSVSAANLEHWRHHTRGQFTARLFPGGHFFLFDGGSPRPTITPPLAWIFERLAQG